MSKKVDALSKLKHQIEVFSKAYDAIKDIPDEVFDAIFISNGGGEIDSTINKILERGEENNDGYGSKRKNVRDIIAASERAGIKKKLVIKTYEKRYPDESNIPTLVTNAINGLKEKGEIENHPTKGRGYWRVK